jgi:hypothetical protein
VKNIVYLAKINALQHLKARRRDAVATVTPNMLQATLKFTEKVIYSEKKTLIISLYNGETHECV